MKTSLKASLSNKKTLLILSLICIVVGAGCCLLGALGELILPVVIATLAAVYVFDKKRTCALILSGVLVAFNAVGIIVGFNLTFFSLSAIICALIIAVAYSRGQSKADAAFLATITGAAITVAGMIFYAMIVVNEFSFDAAFDYYADLYELSRQMYIDMLNQFFPQLADMTVQMVDTVFSLVISYLIIGAFIVVGFSMKIFGLAVGKCAEDNTAIRQWRFATSNIYAYFYLILSMATVFVSSVDNIFGIAIFNLYYIFMIIYAYVGFMALAELLKTKLHPALSYLIVGAGTLAMFSLAPQILAVVGVISTFRANRKLAS